MSNTSNAYPRRSHARACYRVDGDIECVCGFDDDEAEWEAAREAAHVNLSLAAAAGRVVRAWDERLPD